MGWGMTRNHPNHAIGRDSSGVEGVRAIPPKAGAVRGRLAAIFRGCAG